MREDYLPFKRVRRQPSSRCSPQENSTQPNRLPQRERFSLLSLLIGLGWLASNFSLQARAADMSIGNQGVRVNRDTTLETDFIESHGAYQSTFGVINLTTKEKTPLLVETKPSDQSASVFHSSSFRSHIGTQDDFLGTPGNAVPQPKSTYTFKPNNEYVFYLESTFNGRPTGVLYSTDRLNPNQERQVQFQGNLNSLCQSGGMTLGWDDTGSRLVRNRSQQDRDFDDFIVRVRDTACPIGGGEPPPVTSAIEPPGTPVGQLPPTATPIAGAPGGGSSFLLPGLLGAGAIAGLAVGLSGGGGGGGDSGGTPPEQVPEPLTMLGSGAAVGFATLLHRRRSRNQKSQKK